MSKKFFHITILFFLFTHLSIFSQTVLRNSTDDGPIRIGTDGVCTDWQTTNFGTVPGTYVMRWTWNNAPNNCSGWGSIRSLFKFDLNTPVSSQMIYDNRAYMLLYFLGGTQTQYSPNSFYVERIIQPWNEMTVTWDNQPAVTVIDRITVPNSTSTTQDYVIDLSVFVREWLCNGVDNQGVKLTLVDEASNSYQRISLGTKENPDTSIHPKLQLEYARIEAQYAFCTGGNFLSLTSTLTNANDPSVYNFSWTHLNSGTTHIGTDWTNPVYVSGATNTYVLSVSNPWCQAATDTLVLSHPTGGQIPTSDFTVTSPVCIGNTSAIVYTGNANSTALYTWDFDGGTVVSGAGQGPYQVSWANSGTYNVSLTVEENGCPSLLTVDSVTVTPTPSAPVIYSNNPVCEGDTILLAADTIIGATYSWTGPNNFVSNSQYAFVANSSQADTGQYELVVSINGCNSAPGQENITVIPFVSPQITGVTEICQGQSTTLDVGTYSDYLWSSGETTQTVTISNAGTYSVTVTDDDGCTGIASAVVELLPPPPANAGTDEDICLNNTVQLNGTGGVAYSWSPTIGLSDSQIANPIASPTVTTTYVLTTTDAVGCSGTDEVVITVHPSPVADYSTNLIEGCAPLSVSFNNMSSSDVVSWSWHFGDTASGVNNTSNQQNPIHVFRNPGSYSVILAVTSAYGCQGQVSYPNLITVHPNPRAMFTYYPPYADIDNPVIHFINQSTNYSSSLWHFGDNQGSVSNQDNPSYEYQNPGEYNVVLTVSSGAGCTDTIRHTITVRPFYTFYVPSAFTPNGDGINDVFTPKGININNELYNLHIYDRWGKLIFETNDYNFGWDGRTESGTLAPVGVYTWVIFIKSHDGTEFIRRYTGHVSLLSL